MAQRHRQQGSLNWDVLSPREREVTLLVAKGFANKTIAHQLKVAEGTVKVHLHRVYQKLGIKSRYTLAVLATKFPPEPSATCTDPVDAS